MGGQALKVDEGSWDVEVMKAQGLVMVDFWAVWCGPCQMVAPIVDELATEYAGKLRVMKLNTDENPEIAGRYQVMSITTILFFKNGQLVGGAAVRTNANVLSKRTYAGTTASGTPLVETQTIYLGLLRKLS